MSTPPRKFRSALLIDADGTPRPFRPDAWQSEDFDVIDGGAKRVYFERPRGHSKTADLAVVTAYKLAFAEHAIKGVAAAADRDQAGLLRDSIRTLCRLNPWLAELLEVQNLRVVNRRTGSEMEVIASDAATSWGLLPDFVVCDELSNWKSEELWQSLLSSAAKRANCQLVIISNAGIRYASSGKESWHWKVREACRVDPAWHFASLDGPKASWITEDRLAEQRRLLPEVAYRRLWLNQWSDGAGDAISEDDLTAAIKHDGPMDGSEQGWVFAAGLDLGLSKDASALVIVGKHIGHVEVIDGEEPILTPMQRVMVDLGQMEQPIPDFEEIHHEGSGNIRLAYCQVWRPSAGQRVQLAEVEAAILEVDQRFRLSCLAYDPWQSEFLAERLGAAGLPVNRINFGASNLQDMAGAILTAFTERRLELYNDSDVVSDLRALRVKDTTYGIRLDSPRGPSGHGDSATALALALLAIREAEPGQWRTEFAYDGAPLTCN